MKDKNNLFTQTSSTQIHCPSCGEEIDAEGAMELQAEQKLRAEFNQRFLKLKKNLEDQESSLERERLEVKRLSSQTWEIIQEELKKEKLRLTQKLESEIQEKSAWEISELKKTIDQQQKDNLDLKQKEIEILRKERELESAKERWQLEQEKERILQLKKVESEFRSQYQAQQELVKLEYERKLADQKKLIEEMSRKMDQGSMKLQGDVQEQAIESYLRATFPHDDIRPVRSGSRGADCLHEVFSGSQLSCGLIYYESKRTKSFQTAWIEKFKMDMRANKADIGILVTQSMPKGMERMGELEGIWICTYEDFKVLTPIIRDGLIRLSSAMQMQQRSGDKMSVLYNYLISSEFRMQIEGIVEGFTRLQSELNKEKRAMHAIWKRREKQIEKVLLNTNYMYSSIKGIAGQEVKDIDALSLPDVHDESKL
ncbi:MAG: DUF2130 domain-containing protein [Saprospiraceae bacterium]|nr:DUF2130 domain-containing protein [Saprospiraceae bacterium]